MQLIDPAFDPAAFTAALNRARQRALFLDYDGTLAPFQIERDEATPYAGVRGLLAGLLESGRTHLIVISGRAIRDLLPLLDLPAPPEIWGSHGWERLHSDGRYEIGDIGDAARQGLSEAKLWLQQQKLTDRCEQKPASVALHWRGLPGERIETLEHETKARWSEIAVASGLELHPFDGGLELRKPGRDKGTVIEQLLAELGDEMVAAFLGDDRTDEDAFRAMKGRGMTVLVRRERRPTQADLWLVPPEELLAFLSNWLILTLNDGNENRPLFPLETVAVIDEQGGQDVRR